MFVEVARIDFSDVITGGAATLTLILMAVTSISDGMAIGLIVYAIAMVITGRARRTPHRLRSCRGARRLLRTAAAAMSRGVVTVGLGFVTAVTG